MPNCKLLHQVAFYSKERIDSRQIEMEQFVSVDNINQNKQGISKPGYEPKGSLIHFKKGDILVGNIRPYLKKIWHASFNGGCSPDVLVLRANENINSTFLYYSLFRDDFFDHMMKGAKGTKMPRGDKDQVLDFQVPDFSLNDQRKIASTLSVLDSKIELNNRINAELEAMAKTIYDYWFVQFDFPDKNGKPYKSSGGKMVWNEELKREVPEGWEIVQVDYYADVIDPHPSHRAPVEFENGFPFAGIGDIDDQGNISISKARRINEDFVLKQERDYKIGEYSLGYGRVGTVGKVVKLRKQNFRYALSPTMAVINPKKDVYPSFVYYTLKNSIFYNSVKKFIVGSTRPAIGIQELRKVPVVKPNDKGLIQKFENLTLRTITQSDVLNRQNQQLITLRDWLLPMLMNGQVRVGEAKEKVTGEYSRKVKKVK